MSTQDKLPPLPEPWATMKKWPPGAPWFTADQMRAYARAALAAQEAEPVAWADDCRLSLVTALYFLASDFENALYKFDGDDEARRSANGSIAHARKVAARWNWNGAQPAREAVALTEEQEKAIKQWLNMGDESLGLAHKGYFSKGGWAYEQLAALLQANNLREPT